MNDFNDLADRAMGHKNMQEILKNNKEQNMKLLQHISNKYNEVYRENVELWDAIEKIDALYDEDEVDIYKLYNVIYPLLKKKKNLKKS